MGAEIDARLPPGPLTVVGVLRGAFVFMADLVRAIPRELTCDFLGVRSYGDATVSSGVVEITSDLGAPIAGRQVLLVEDIVDTGLTLRYLLDLLRARGPASVHVCALLAKPSYKECPARLRRLPGARRVRGRLRPRRPAALPEPAGDLRAGGLAARQRSDQRFFFRRSSSSLSRVLMPL